MPGFGPVLAAEFLGAPGEDLTVFQTADWFAGVAGIAPRPGTPAGPPATTTVAGATIGGSCGPTTTGNAPKEKSTSKRSSHWHGDG